jgi:hypothetical protein
MTIAIDLDEPHLKREGTLKDPLVPCKQGNNKQISRLLGRRKLLFTNDL